MYERVTYSTYMQLPSYAMLVRYLHYTTNLTTRQTHDYIHLVALLPAPFTCHVNYITGVHATTVS